MLNKWHVLKQITLLFICLCATPALAQPCTQLLIASYTPGIVCNGRPLNLSANTIAGATYSWTGPAGFTSTAQNPVIASTMLNQGGSYIVTATAGSCIYKDTVNINMNLTPLSPMITANNPPCKGGSMTFSISSGQSGTTFALYNPNGVLMPTFISTLSTSHNGTYKAVATATNGCKSDTGYYLLQVIDLPTPTLLADTPICRGDTLHMYVMNNTPIVDNYYWNTPAANPFYTSPVPLHLPNVTVGGFYTVQTVLDGCMSPVAYNLVGFRPSLYADVSVAADGEIHTNYTEMTFTAHITNGGGSPTLQWFKNGAPVPNATDTVYNGILFADIMPMDWFYAQVQRDSACGGISYSDTIQVAGVLSVSDAGQSNDISLYPNPTNGSFILETPMLTGSVMIEIFDPVGRTVYSTNKEAKRSTEILLPECIPSGIYMLRLSDQQTSYFSRLMVGR